jgi:hypothetical protein
MSSVNRCEGRQFVLAKTNFLRHPLCLLPRVPQPAAAQDLRLSWIA